MESFCEGLGVSGRLFTSDAAREVTTVSIVVTDRGPEPEWHKDRRLYGPWSRYRAEVAGYAAVEGSVRLRGRR